MNTHATPSHGTVHLEVTDGIAVLTIDNPPVNAGSHAIRKGLIEALRSCGEVRGAVLVGAGKSFIAGSDLREFGAPLAWPELPDVIAACEEAPFPVVAAIHGVALGGGLELALGCDYRIATPDAKLGLPEVSLGMVPGAGGTQRLPRLTGRIAALEMICGATRITGVKAEALGLVDVVAEDDLLGAAKRFLAEDRPKRVVANLEVPEEDETALGAAAAKALHKGRGRPNVAEAIRLVQASADPDIVAVLADERAAFQKLRLSEDAFALRHLFFAERKAGSVDGLDAKPRPVSSVGVIGGGTMGQGIARACLAAGLPVTLVERDAEALERSLGALRDALQAKQARGRLSETALAAQLRALSGTTRISELTSCDLVIEAVFEELSVKVPLLTELDATLPPETVIGTNTSYLDINAMVAGLPGRSRVLGLHFFSPADVMRLLEVVRAETTADDVLATGLALAKRLGKQPVVARVAEGFIGNRIYAAYRRRAELLVLDGAAPEQVDAAVEAFGFAMGPFAVSDMSGLDIAWAMRKRQAATRDPAARYVTIPDRLCEAGRLGRKTGGGWYDYPEKRPEPSAEVTALIDAARSEAGITPRSLDAETIQRQLLIAMVNEAALLLDEGVAQRASDIDVTLANGYGFPRWKGGPLWWAAQQPADRIEADLDALETAIGHGFARGPVPEILEDLKG
ncbi:3-hydroxyacyl-CoA dehydrogenase NAD-binding domain-containing protein [Alloyangia pacifica]|uniref:3-hydroxyacyl-CoA dehydrogenase n=1 Tax=Alloyangia pacifica TaxID=311180 RepID=A0A1I6V0H9_9RHOB|nr:3-hydroxyacyl-CoA dehydrogenase NAD-binding domain-containing protein [Alloyangia pacifica]SDI33131.1 3-hydroxyacyl-CoA dehydrogenase [Alloyangia pacifica]SFT07154.1 3-hydroxyacyl-CoA dehydrogenase [Alloyangia pacifica]